MSKKAVNPSFSVPKSSQPMAEQNPYQIYYDNYLNTNAATECTGLGYRMPINGEEWDSYRKVFDFLPVPDQDSEE